MKRVATCFSFSSTAEKAGPPARRRGVLRGALRASSVWRNEVGRGLLPRRSPSAKSAFGGTRCIRGADEVIGGRARSGGSWSPKSRTLSRRPTEVAFSGVREPVLSFVCGERLEQRWWHRLARAKAGKMSSVRRVSGVLGCFVCSLVIVPVVAMSTPAAASGHVWRVHTLPRTPHAGEFTPYAPEAVSCPTRTWCMTVGSYGRANSEDVGAGSYAYSVVDSHGRLTNKGVPSPADLRPDDQALVSTLYSVSCLSPKSCLAVGAYNRRYPGHDA
jgi:hypothetical protein